MKLFEYMGKELFVHYGIPVPRGSVCRDAAAARQFVAELGAPVVLKAQVLTGGRGKAGGIKSATDPDQAEALARELLQGDLRGYAVEALLVEEKLQIDQEFYLAVTMDAVHRCPLIIAARSGGMEIEAVPEAEIVRQPVDHRLGLAPFIVRDVVTRLGLAARSSLGRTLADIIAAAFRLAREKDAELVEINPLIRSGEALFAADAKITVDDDALFRQAGLPRVEEATAVEREAKALGLAFVDLDGEIGVMANGAGITMATLDLISHYGRRAANFLDIGGGADRATVGNALRLVLSKRPRTVLINVFGGITRCDEVAGAIVDVKRQHGFPVPVVVRLVGTNQETGQTMLREAGLEALSDMQEAARRAAELAG